MASNPTARKEWDAAEVVTACYLLETMMYYYEQNEDEQVASYNSELERMFRAPTEGTFTALQLGLDKARQSLYLVGLLGISRSEALATARRQYNELSNLNDSP